MSSINKIKTILISVAGGLAILSAVLFFVAPLIISAPAEGVSLRYDAFSIFVAGLSTLFTFDIENRLLLIYLGFAIVSTVVIIWWVVVLCLKKKYKDILWIIPVIALNFVLVFIMASYALVMVESTNNGFVISESSQPGKFSNFLFAQILAKSNKGNLLASVLASVSLLFVLFSLVLACLFVFYDVTVTTSELKPEVKVVKVVQTKVVKRYDNSDEDYYERMIREMGMFHEEESK